MIISAWRIFKPAHKKTAFSGEGARLYGGRWNSKGTSVVYTSQTLSLAALELLVHLNSPEVLLMYLACDVRLDSSLVKRLDPRSLPKDWRSDPPPPRLQQIGDEWILSGDSAVLQVPSAVVEAESNFLLNPSHPSFRRLRIGVAKPFQYDPRLA